MSLRRRLAALLAALVLSPAASADKVVVFAAASLQEGLEAAAKPFEERTGHRVVLSFAGSNALARQIENGAPADLFISADPEWADYVEQRGLATPGSRRNLVANELVLVAPAASAVQVKLAPGVDLAAPLGGKRLAIADPEAVPAGRYAQLALTNLGAWGAVQKQVAPAENVRAALALVAHAEAPLGVVYRTDAMAERAVRIVDRFPPDSHPRIVYAMLRVKRSTSPAGAAFEDFLASREALSIFTGLGFVAP
ncbi:MAG TPA: molybdate ABC transporter substrate-binding protein [Usitatibacter sp.]|nr:molybdate ABC transporter substrate-binding protein [Usitatibacter sp.]